MPQLNCTDEIEVVKRNTVACECNCKDGNPPATASWYDKDGNVIGKNGYLKKTLLIENLQKQHTGTYECRCKSGTLPYVAKKLKLTIGCKHNMYTNILTL